MKHTLLVSSAATRCQSKVQISRLLRCGVLLLLLCSWPAFAANTPAAERPTIKELNPVMAKSCTETLTKLFSKVYLTIQGQPTNEIQEIGAPGWAPLNSPDSEDIFWPVKVKTSVRLAGSGGETNLTVGFNFRVYRAKDGGWKSAYAGLHEHPDLEQQSRRVVEMFMKTKGSGSIAMKNACINNLRQLDGAKEQWALENRKTQNDLPVWGDLIGMDRYIKVRPECPDEGTYMLGTMRDKPKCSIEGHELP
jgi:hypothetical protein